ncbi:MAG: hypothetical protein WAU11_14870 [Ignavibacteriaceae bacterium]
MGSRKYIVFVVFLSLLIWVPFNHSWELWLLFRIASLILVPFLMWFILKLLWQSWKPSIETEDRIERTLAGVTSGALFVLAIIEATTKSHVENSLSIQTRDGFEDVGDYIIQQGANWGGAIVLIILALFAFWFSISKRELKH